MSELDKLLVEIFDLKSQKIAIVKSQQYEKAAILREKERTLERKAYNILYDVDEDGYDWKKYEDGIKVYLMNEYRLEYNNVDSFSRLKILLIRESKLKDLGI